MKDAEVEGCYSFESFSFNAATGELLSPDRSCKLRPQASKALEILVSRHGGMVTREELRDALWPDERIVMFESSIAAVIRELRRALGDDSKSPRFIETIPKRGYRFVAAVARPPVEADAQRDERQTAGVRRRYFRATAGGFLTLAQGLAIALIVLLPGAVERMPPLAEPPAEPVYVSVLPFEAADGAPAQAALAEALPRYVVGRLGPVAPERLRIIDAGDPRETGGADPDYLLRGSIRDAGAGEAVVSVRLLTGSGGAYVWGEDYRRAPAAVDLTAREVSARIAGNVLSSALPLWHDGYSPSPPVAVPAAAQHYRRGVEALGRFDPDANAEAVHAFEEAIRLDPEFDAAHARLAEALTHWVGPVVTPDRIERARRAALAATELAPRNALAQRVLGEIALFFDRDWRSAGERLSRSVQLAPAAAPGHHSYAAWLSARGRHAEALREIELAGALDPGSVAISIDVMLLHYYARDFAGTIAAADRLQQLWPESHSSYRFAVLSHLELGNDAEAADRARAALAIGQPALAESRAALGDSEALEAYWRTSLEVVRQFVRERNGDPTFLSLLYLQLGQPDAAIDTLEEALARDRFSYFLPYLGVSPAYDPLCGHPRFERILRGLHQAALSSESVDSRCAAVLQAARTPAEPAR